MTERARADLGVALCARTAAVVGATDRGAGLDLWSNLSLVAETVVVHRTGRAADGAAVVASIDDLPFAPDVCALAIGARGIVAGARDAIARGSRMLVVPGLGPEDGEAGDRRARRARRAVRRLRHPARRPELHGRGRPGRRVALDRQRAARRPAARRRRLRRALRIARRGAAARRPALRAARGGLERQRDRPGRRRLARDARGGRRDHGASGSRSRPSAGRTRSPRAWRSRPVRESR